MKNDTNTTLEQLRTQMAEFVKAREWNQFHTAKNLSMYVAVEAAELMEKFLWITTQEEAAKLLETNRQAIEEEVADVLAVLMAFANTCNIDITKAFIDKMAKNAKKYPVDLSKGSVDRYLELHKKK
jgi:NTP pyrophosphatase (non-canonical NTP hydrolase)